MSDRERAGGVPVSSSPVERAVHRYRRQLGLLPRAFRAEFEAELIADFAALVERAYEVGGVSSVSAVTRRALWDVVTRSVVERAHERAAARRRRKHGSAGRPRRGGLDRMLDAMRELRLAARALVRRPAFSVVAVLTLALGIGANVAIFSVVNGVLLRPLPYPDSDRIVVVEHHAPGLNLPELANSAGTLDFYREFAETITPMAAVDERTRNLSGVDRPERVDLVGATPEFFDVVGVRPAMGRPFEAQDVAPGAAAVAILMHGSWQSRFGGASDVLGRVIEFDGVPTEIVGVMPKGFAWGDPDEFALVPLMLDPQRSFGTFGLMGVARLAGGATLESARAEIERLQARLPDRFEGLTQEFLDGAGWSVSVTTMKERMVREVRTALWVLLGTVVVVLLIAGANVANLFLVRAESRQREVAVRAALGAGRGRLTAAFFSESGILAALGGVAGVVLATAGVRLLVARGPAELPRLHEVGMDGSALGFALLLSMFVAALLALVPMARYAGRPFAGVLRESGRGNTAGRERHAARKALITAQVALALVLLVGSGLMLRSASRLAAVDPGVETDGVLTVGVSIGDNVSRAQATQFYQRVLDEVGALAGVASVGASNSLPLDPRGLNGSSFAIESRPRAEDELPPVAMYTVVTPGYFESIGMPLLAGRTPERRDHEGGEPVVWVNEMFSRQFLEGNAVGERVRFGTDSTFATIAGVVGDVRTFGLNEEIRPMAYMPMTTTVQSLQVGVMFLVLRTGGDPLALTASVRQAVQRIDATVPLTAVRTMDQILRASLAETSFTTLLLGLAAGVALLLGVIGLYGVISYVVGQRTGEIGVRMALGARPGDVRSMVLRQGLGVTLVGVGLGLLTSLAVSRLLASLLFEVSARDPVTFIGVALLLTFVSLLATWLPARRAAGVDPIVALRSE